MGKNNNITPAQQQNCEVTGREQVRQDHTLTPLIGSAQNSTFINTPMILTETDLQIAVEADIDLNPPASEIKRVKKHVELDQVKLVPVRFEQINDSDYYRVTRAKLFVGGHIHKNIEYASNECNGALQDRIARVVFSGFTELTEDDFYNAPILGVSSNAEANFVNESTQLSGRLDKYFFQNQVKYNEQPYGELVAANFYELDYAPESAHNDNLYDRIREKVVLDLTLKVIQVQQIYLPGTEPVAVVPDLEDLTPPAPTSGEGGGGSPVPEIPNEE